MTNADCKNKWGTKCAQIEHMPDNTGAWYCGNENVSNYDPSDFDAAFIHKSCNSGVYWDEKRQIWYCKN